MENKRLISATGALLITLFFCIFMVPYSAFAGLTDMAFKKFNTNTGQWYISDPDDCAIDGLGNIYVTDSYNNRVQKYASDGTYITSWGGDGSGNGQFSIPRGIAVDPSGNVYVVDSKHDRVQKFDTYGNFITAWGSWGDADGQFKSPVGITIDSAGAVYVADTENNRIQKFNANGGYLWKWGALGSANDQLNHPFGIAVDASGNIYISDRLNYRIVKLMRYTMNGNVLFAPMSWGSAGGGNGQFCNPAGIEVDGDGHLFVADQCNYRIQKFHLDGSFERAWGYEDGLLNNPYGVAVDASGNVYVADTGHECVQKFTGNGVFLQKWVNYSGADGWFHAPTGMAEDSAGNIYVADTANHRVQKFTAGGTFITTWGNYGTDNNEFKGPRGPVIDSSNNVYVIDYENFCVKKFNSSGTYITKWGDNFVFADSQGIAIDSSNNIYVTDAFYNYIQKFNTSGALQATYSSSLNKPTGIAVDSSGNMYVLETNNHLIKKFNSSGVLQTSWGGSGNGDGEFRFPAGVAVDASGNVYVADRANSRLQQFTSDGTFTAKVGIQGMENNQFSYPAGIAIRPSSGKIYVADTANNRIMVQSNKDKPTVVSAGPSGAGLGGTFADVGGTVTSDGGVFVYDRGVVYGPYIEGLPLEIGASNSCKVAASSTGTGVFNVRLTGLDYDSDYRVRAYAINNEDTSYGDIINFTTHLSPYVPGLTTGDATAVMGTSAIVHGEVTDTGYGIISERGFVYAFMETNPTIATGTKVTVPLGMSGGMGAFSAELTGLTDELTYYVRAYAINEMGTNYGLAKNFSTYDAISPTVLDTAINVSNITATGATLSWAKATDDTTAQGDLVYLVYQSTSANIGTYANILTNGTAIGTYTADIGTKSISGLTPEQTYWFNVVVRDLIGNTTVYTMVSVTPSGSPSTSTTTTPATTTSTVPADDYGNSCETAYAAGLNSTLGGEINYPGDYDYFSVVIPSAASLTVYTTGATDTKGCLKDSSCADIVCNDDNDTGVNNNFSITQAVTPGTYYVAVQYFDNTGTGAYVLQFDTTADPGSSTTTTTIAGSTTTTSAQSTTTTAGSTTTTTAKSCPFKRNAASDAAVQPLRQLRDAQIDTAFGAVFVSMYYQNMDEISDILRDSRMLHTRFNLLTRGNMPVVGKLLRQGSASIRAHDLLEMHEFLTDLQGRAGLKLQMDIDFILRVLNPAGFSSGWG